MDKDQWDRWAAVIGGHVARIRRAKGMTQEQVAEAAGTSKPAVSRLESGRHLPSLQSLIDVAMALGVGPCELLKPARKPRGK